MENESVWQLFIGSLSVYFALSINHKIQESASVFDQESKALPEIKSKKLDWSMFAASLAAGKAHE
ncbi:hypothetical protein [Cohnella fermenti]|uniref:Uncharacterized protein n=1 Tax=Cohnella fermenti TaxID=2565925 RepID=A0A4S4BU51_9BACL|nr:hypothetical protein [Cohnella fermenti]THF76427.1 hypothetical protein E6C55_19365 [Cohnella fermenti]